MLYHKILKIRDFVQGSTLTIKNYVHFTRNWNLC